MSNTNPQWTTNSDCPDDEREALANKWINSVYHLHDRSTGTVRKTLGWDIYYIETYSGFGVPIVNAKGEWGLQYWLDRKEDGFALVPLVPSDAKLHPFFASILYRPLYFQQPRAIYLPGARVSSPWRAIVMHHELGHAMFHRLNLHREDQMAHWTEEYKVYKSEFRLLSRLYGRAYSRMVYTLSKKYEPGFREGKLHTNSAADVSREQLKRIFGKSQSAFEYQVQRCAVMLNATYRALDRIHTDGNKTKHHVVTKWFYGKNNKVIPAAKQ